MFPALETKGSSLQRLLFLFKRFKKGKDDRHRQEDSRAGSNGTHEIGNNGKGPNAHASKRGGGGNVAVEHVNERRITVSLHDHLIVAELFGHIARGRPRHFNPGLAEQSARGQNEDQVKDGVERIVDNFGHGLGW